MGFRGEISDNHAGKIVEVLGPFVPGLTIAPPSDTVPTPGSLGAHWTPAKVGAKLKWTVERKRRLLADVEHLKQEGRARTDKEALAVVSKSIVEQGGANLGVNRRLKGTPYRRAIGTPSWGS
ncbi:hypothetical protein BH10PSE1_BH10PSE1_18570 [soil metagenome]